MLYNFIWAYDIYRSKQLQRTIVSLPVQFRFVYEYFHKRAKTADLGGQCLFLNKEGFRRRRHLNKRLTS